VGNLHKGLNSYGGLCGIIHYLGNQNLNTLQNLHQKLDCSREKDGNWHYELPNAHVNASDPLLPSNNGTATV